MNIKIIIISSLTFLANITLLAQTTPLSQMENLNRGVVVLPGEAKGQFVSWRLLGTDPENTTFDIIRDGNVIATNLYDATSYQDDKGNVNSKYVVVTKVDGIETERSSAVVPWTGYYKAVRLQRPNGGILPWRDFDDDTRTYGSFYNKEYTYEPQKMSTADVDGDGEYELIVKWEPTNQQPSSSSHGKTGNVIMDCYKINFTQKENSQTECQLLWRIDLGQNIRAGQGQNHFMVYDLDGNGRAEMVMKTGPGSKDGMGNFVNQFADEEEIRLQDNQKDWRDANGKIRGGGEYLTVFDGLTGRAIHTVWYNPNRNAAIGGEADGTFNWAEGGTDTGSYGHRGNCTLACVAYLSGQDKNPSVVMTRGYYTYAYLWAVDFDGTKLSTRWLHASVSQNHVKRFDGAGNVKLRTYKTNTFGTSLVYTAYGQGNHNLSVADVDNDGCDEIIYGGATIDNDGWLLYSTGLGHGDALHVGDFLPDRPGLEVWRCCEISPFGAEMHDAATGEKIFHRKANGDTGRCMAADIDSRYRGAEYWASDSKNVCWGEAANVISTNRPSYNFRIYWDGDLQDELIGTVSASHPMLEKWSESKDAVSRMYINGKNIYELGNSRSCYTTKGFPCLQADLFGDWREEMIFYDGNDPEVINIFSTSIPTKFRTPTLMHDHLYRMSIVWQNDCYSQPPHLSYYLRDRFLSRFDMIDENLRHQVIDLGQSITPITYQLVNCSSSFMYATYLDGKRIKLYGVPEGFSFSNDKDKRLSTLTGTPPQAGTYEFIIRSSGHKIEQFTDTLRIVVNDATAIDKPSITQSKPNNNVYGIQGQKIKNQPLRRRNTIGIKNKRKFIIK